VANNFHDGNFLLYLLPHVLLLDFLLVENFDCDGLIGVYMYSVFYLPKGSLSPFSTKHDSAQRASESNDKVSSVQKKLN
tara:strand:- start:664 stop:900 length:237 start_codon:yes stop_codon:yes gene_type:complete